MKIPRTAKTVKELNRIIAAQKLGKCGSCAFKLMTWKFRGDKEFSLVCSSPGQWAYTHRCVENGYQYYREDV